ncbi:MAG: YdeI/OmpD-associated family protein [Bacteroidota bacterium]
MPTFSSKIFKIGINPCVIVPAAVLKVLFAQAGKSKGPIPVKGKLNGAAFLQTVVKFSGAWRLYLNGKMLKDAGIKNGDMTLVTGEMAYVEIEFDIRPRHITMHNDLELALKKNKKASSAFDSLSPYRKKEIVRYIGNLKSEEAVQRNIKKAIQHLSGNGSFAGRIPENKGTKKRRPQD